MRLRFLALTPLLAIACLAPACSSDSSDDPSTAPRGELTYEVFPWTRELTADTLASADVSANDGTVRFRGAPAQVQGLKQGDVLLAGVSPTTPRGLLRMVLEARDEGGDVVVTTRPAPIQAAFRTLHARIPSAPVALDGTSTDPFRAIPQSKYAVSNGVGGGRSIDWRVFDQDKNRETKDDQLYVTGQVTGKVSLTAYVDLDWADDPVKVAKEIACLGTVGLLCKPELPDVKLGVIAEAIAAVEIDAEGAAAKEFSSDEIPMDDSSFDLPPLVIGPVVVFPSIDFIAQISGAATSQFHAKAGVHYSAVTEASIGLKSGPYFKPPTFTREVVPPTVETALTSEVKASVGPRIHLMFWDTFGPSVSALGYGRLRANTEANPCYAVDVGAELGVTLSLRIPWKLFDGGAETLAEALGLDGDLYSKHFGPYELFSVPDVASGSCGELPPGLHPPGDGPTLETFMSPSFTPWSRRYMDDSTYLYQYPYSFEAGQALIHADKSVDGGWLASGRGIYGVVKVSEGGELRWGKNLYIAPLDDREYESERPAAVAAQAANTAIWTAASRMTLMQLDQDGDLLWARRFVPTAPAGDAAGDALLALGSQLDPAAVVEAKDRSVFVLYSLLDTPKDGPALLLRATPEGKVLWAREIAFETQKTMIHAMALDGDDVLLSGYSWEPGSEVARVLRVRGDGSLAYAKRLDVCGNERVRPVELLRLASGAFAVVGGYDMAPERSFIAQMPADGSSVSVSAWETGDALADLRASQLVQSPMTGFISASQIVPITGSPLRLTKHDAQGVATNQVELTMTTDGTTRDSFPGAIRLTTDGGLLLFAHSERGMEGPPGLWLSKIPASTLTADFSGTPIALSTPSTSIPTCAATLTDESGFSLAEVGLESIDYTDHVKVKDVPLSEEKLLPK